MPDCIAEYDVEGPVGKRSENECVWLGIWSTVSVVLPVFVFALPYECVCAGIIAVVSVVLPVVAALFAYVCVCAGISAAVNVWLPTDPAGV